MCFVQFPEKRELLELDSGDMMIHSIWKAAGCSFVPRRKEERVLPFPFLSEDYYDDEDDSPAEKLLCYASGRASSPSPFWMSNNHMERELLGRRMFGAAATAAVLKSFVKRSHKCYIRRRGTGQTR